MKQIVMQKMERQISTTKPKFSINELAAKRRRCAEAKQAGKPCTEFAQKTKTHCVVSLNIGNVMTAESRQSLKQAASRWGADYHEITSPISGAGRPHWQKSHLDLWAKSRGYSRVLYIDADVLVRSDAPNPIARTIDGTIGVVSDDQFDFVNTRLSPDYEAWAKRLGMPVPPHHLRCNSGLIVFSPEIHGPLFAAWRRAAEMASWGKDPTLRLVDQAALSVLLQSYQVTWLPQKYNCQSFGHFVNEGSGGPMQAWVYHFSGPDAKKRMGSVEWRKEKYRRMRGSKVPAIPPPGVKIEPSGAAVLGDVDIGAIFDRIEVINLDRRQERWQEFVKGMPSPWPFVKPRRFRAIDREKVPAPSWVTINHGMWACLQSHRRAIENAINDGMRSVLIFEDDANFVGRFLDRFNAFIANVPDDWECLMLGGRVKRGKPIRVNDEVVIPPYIDLNHAYALRGNGLLAAYDALSSPRPERIENDELLGEAIEAGKMRAYAPSEWLCGQRKMGSDNL